MDGKVVYISLVTLLLLSFLFIMFFISNKANSPESIELREALTTNKIESCDAISRRDFCYYFFARKFNNSTLCSFAGDFEEECILELKN